MSGLTKDTNIKLVTLDTWEAFTKVQEFSGTLTAKNQHEPMDDPTRMHRCATLAFIEEAKAGWKFLGQFTLYGVYTLVFEKEGETAPTMEELLKHKEEKPTKKK